MWRPPRSPLSSSSAASDVYKRQEEVDHFDPAVARPLLPDDGLVVGRSDVDVVGNGHLSRETVCASADALVVNEAVIKQWLSL